MKLPKPMSSFHPAIFDWYLSEGEAFDADLYCDYEEVLETFDRKLQNASDKHHRNCREGNCDCGLNAPTNGQSLDRTDVTHRPNCKKGKCICAMVMERPHSADFISGTPSKRTLVDVLLHVMGAGHLLPLSQKNQLKILEVYRRIPSHLTKEAIAKKKEEEAKAMDKANEGVAEADVVVSEAGILDEAKEGAGMSVAKDHDLQEGGVECSPAGTTNEKRGAVGETAVNPGPDGDTSNGHKDGADTENGEVGVAGPGSQE